LVGSVGGEGECVDEAEVLLARYEVFQFRRTFCLLYVW